MVWRRRQRIDGHGGATSGMAPQALHFKVRRSIVRLRMAGGVWQGRVPCGAVRSRFAPFGMAGNVRSGRDGHGFASHRRQRRTRIGMAAMGRARCGRQRNAWCRVAGVAWSGRGRPRAVLHGRQGKEWYGAAPMDRAWLRRHGADRFRKDALGAARSSRQGEANRGSAGMGWARQASQ